MRCQTFLQRRFVIAGRASRRNSPLGTVETERPLLFLRGSHSYTDRPFPRQSLGTQPRETRELVSERTEVTAPPVPVGGTGQIRSSTRVVASGGGGKGLSSFHCATSVVPGVPEKYESRDVLGSDGRNSPSKVPLRRWLILSSSSMFLLFLSYTDCKGMKTPHPTHGPY